jgi:hypothetical protein
MEIWPAEMLYVAPVGVVNVTLSAVAAMEKPSLLTETE